MTNSSRAGRAGVLVGLLALVVALLSWAVLGDPKVRQAARAPSTTAPSTTTSLTRETYFASSPGTADHACVDVDVLEAQHRYVQATLPDGSAPLRPDGTPQYVLDARSGDFVAGNFYDLAGTGQPGEPDFVAKIYWTPIRPEPNSVLEITAQQLGDQASAPIVIQAPRYAFGATGFFWPSAVPLPAHGRWRITAETPDLSGCFDLSV